MLSDDVRWAPLPTDSINESQSQREVACVKFTTSLKKNYEFRRLYNRGKNAASPYAVVYCRKNGKSSNRLGVTVSTKLGGAVQRNRIKRRIKEIYKISEQKLISGYDIVIVARIKSKTSGFRELEDSVLSLFQKLKIIRQQSGDSA